jgi:hypothetical protein
MAMTVTVAALARISQTTQIEIMFLCAIAQEIQDKENNSLSLSLSPTKFKYENAFEFSFTFTKKLNTSLITKIVTNFSDLIFFTTAIYNVLHPTYFLQNFFTFYELPPNGFN